MTGRATRAIGRWMGVAVAAAILALAPQARPDDPEQADVHFERANELYQKGDYRAALIELRRAHELAPHHEVLFHIGRVQHQLDDYAGALTTLQRYLDRGSEEIDPERREAVEEDIERLKGRVAHVTVETDVSGATIYVDDEEAGTSPLTEALMVSAGRREITARKDGHRPDETTLDLAGGDRRSVSLALEPVPAAPPLRDEEREDAYVPWAAWSTTAGFGVGTLVFGLLSLTTKSDLSTAKTQPTTAEELDDERNELLAYSILTDVMLAGTLVSGGIATYLTVVGNEEDAPEAAWRLGVGLGTVSFGGTF